MSKERKQYSPEYKFRMAVEAAKNGTTVSQLASESGVHPTQISEWKATLMTEGASLFERRPAAKGQPTTRTESELYVALSSAQMAVSLSDPSYFRQFVVLTLGSSTGLGHQSGADQRRGRLSYLP